METEASQWKWSQFQVSLSTKIYCDRLEEILVAGYERAGATVCVFTSLTHR